MSKERKAIKKVYFIAITAILLCAFVNAFAYEPFMDQVDRSPNGGDFYPEDYYTINPNSIVSDIDQGLINIFTPIPEPSDSFWLEWGKSFQWHQSDFVKIATAINQIAGKDHLTDWNINVFFSSTCEQYTDGFSTGYFSLFRPTWRRGKLYYEAREIYIDSSHRVVRWGDSRLYPRPIFGWTKNEVNKFSITADEALTMAEKNGGKQIRLDKGNNCRISVIGNDNNWIVLYSPFARYKIDAYSGEIVDSEVFDY